MTHAMVVIGLWFVGLTLGVVGLLALVSKLNNRDWT